MLTLVRNAQTYVPEDLGRCDILIAGGRIVGIGRFPTVGIPGLRILEGSGLLAIPGLVDGHVHILGGGGEGGYATRTPELPLSEAILGGATTVVGCLGTDGVTRGLPALVAKARGLEAEGISTWIYSGAYGVPPPTLTGAIESDLLLIDKVIGVGEVALSDHRSSQATQAEFQRVVAEARRGGMLSGKAGLVNVHLGDGARGLEPLRRLLAETEIPATQVLPTHINRNPDLLAEGADWAKAGGLVDLTSSAPPAAAGSRQIPPAQALRRLLAEGVDKTRVTVSSDGQGSLPEFDAQGRMCGIGVGRVRSLYDAFRAAVLDEGLAVADALAPFTANPARALRLAGKGRLCEGADADLLLVTPRTLELHTVIAKGRILMAAGELKVQGTFERVLAAGGQA